MAIEIVLGSDPDRPNLFAELRHDNQVFADVMYDHAQEAYVVTLYAPAEERINVGLAELGRALSRARQLLVDRGAPNIAG